MAQVCEAAGGSEDSEQTPTLQWLWERRLFNWIYDLPIFRKFRVWKAFQVWRINQQHIKKTASRCRPCFFSLVPAMFICCPLVSQVLSACEGNYRTLVTLKNITFLHLVFAWRCFVHACSKISATLC